MAKSWYERYIAVYNDEWTREEARQTYRQANREIDLSDESIGWIITCISYFFVFRFFAYHNVIPNIDTVNMSWISYSIIFVIMCALRKYRFFAEPAFLLAVMIQTYSATFANGGIWSPIIVYLLSTTFNFLIFYEAWGPKTVRVYAWMTPIYWPVMIKLLISNLHKKSVSTPSHAKVEQKKVIETKPVTLTNHTVPTNRQPYAPNPSGEKPASEYNEETSVSQPLINISKILIVDDQAGIRIILDEAFAKSGYLTFQAKNGMDALEIVRLHSPDLIILDLKIPEMDGIEIQKRVRLIDPTVKVVFITAYPELNLLNEIYEHGALTYFAKPFDMDEIEDYVHSALNINKEQLISLAAGLKQGQNPIDLPFWDRYMKYCNTMKNSDNKRFTYEQYVEYISKY